ncbi:MAG TPA: hypothetical protein VIJ29_04335 [Candidatus Paceibacterota bacterium]
MKNPLKAFAKKYWYVMVVAVFAVAVVAGVRALPAPVVSDAKAQSAIPTIGLTPTYDGSGNITGVALTTSGPGPFTENFQVAICLQEQGRNSNRIDCVHTPWAASSSPAGNSQISGVTMSNFSQWWSAWSASPEQTIDAHWTTTITPPNYRVDNWQTRPTNGGEITMQGTNCSTNSGCGTCYDSGNCTGVGYYYDYGTGWQEVAPSVFVRTAPLPAGEVITNVQLGFEQIDVNDDVSMWNNNAGAVGKTGYGISANVCSNGGVPWVMTPTMGGTSLVSYAYAGGNNCDIAGDGDTGGVQDYFRAYMSANVYNAASQSNNIPSSTNPSAVMTVGSDGKPLTLTVINTGGAPWVSDQSTVISKSGTCDGPNGTQPDPTKDSPAASCITNYINSSNLIELVHAASTFGVGANSLQYSQKSQQTCSLSSSYDCANSSCGSDEQACTTSGYCNVGTFNNPADCGMNGGTWTQGCNSQWVPEVSCTLTSGDPNVEPGATTTFALPSLTAPATPGAYTETWQMQNGSTPFGSKINVPIQVGPASQPAGATVNVLSQNSVNGNPVYAGWNFATYPPLSTDPNYDPCGDTNTICGPSLYESSSTSLNAPTGTYNLDQNPVLAPGNYNNGSQYTFRSIQTVSPIAFHSNTKTDTNSLFALAKGFLPPVANAAHEDTSYPWSQTATSTQSSLAMIILWDPDATLSVSNTSVSVTNSNPTGSFSVSNTGTSGSWVNWNATTTNYSANSNGVNWLSISPSSGSNLHVGDPAVPVTITATPGSLASGTYTATVSFNNPNTQTFPAGVPLNSLSSLPSITVTFTVGNSSPSSCTANSVSVSCPATMQENTTTQCLASVNESGSSCTGTVTWSVVSGSGSITQNGAYTSPNSTGTATIKAVSTDNSGVSNTANITITGSSLSGSPNCSNPIISASPANIVIPESSQLSYNCQNVNSCTLTGSDGSNYSNNITWVNPTTASGTQSVAPSVTTVYTFSCTTGGSGSSASVSLPVQVTVGGTSRCEQNPNGAGCSGQ